MTITFKHVEDQEQWDNLDFRLRNIFIPMLQNYMAARGYPDLVVTSITSGEHESSTHKEHRAVDFRLVPAGSTDVMEEFAQWVNMCFSFAPGYNVALCGITDPKGQHNDHLHIQVPRSYKPTGKISLITG